MCVRFKGEGNDKLCRYGASVVKNPPAMQEARVPGSERAPGEEMATHSSIRAWKSPWTEEPCGLQSLGVAKESNTNEQLNNLIRAKNMPSSVPDTRQS